MNFNAVAIISIKHENELSRMTVSMTRILILLPVAYVSIINGIPEGSHVSHFSGPPKICFIPTQFDVRKPVLDKIT